MAKGKRVRDKPLRKKGDDFEEACRNDLEIQGLRTSKQVPTVELDLSDIDFGPFILGEKPKMRTRLKTKPRIDSNRSKEKL